METGDKIALKNELLRKLIHLSSVYMPVLIFLLDKKLIIILAGIGTLLMILVDVLKHKTDFMYNLYMKLLGKVLRTKEHDTSQKMFTGGTFLLIGVLLSVLLFPSNIAALAVGIMIICDSAAALIGKAFGKTKLLDKTFEGTAAFVITGIIIILLYARFLAPEINLSTALVALMLTAIVEVMPLPVDDNITIPVFFGASYIFLNNLQ